MVRRGQGSAPTTKVSPKGAGDAPTKVVSLGEGGEGADQNGEGGAEEGEGPQTVEDLLFAEDYAAARSQGTGHLLKWLYVVYWARWNDDLAENKRFQNFIIMAIFIASIQVGIQTYPAMEKGQSGDILAVMDAVVLYIFTVEVLVKVFGCGLKPWAYFHDRWNQFDFVVVFVCYMPLDASMVTVLRLFRLLRVLKLVKALPELQVLVMGLLNSLSSIFYVALLLMLVFYLYAVMCISLFRDNDPVHFPDLQTTFLTLFRMATFEDWTDVMYIQMYGCDAYPFGFRQHLCTDPKALGWFPAVFFITFVVLSSFVVLNLFIGVITSNMDEARNALKHEEVEEDTSISVEEQRCIDASTKIKDLVTNLDELTSGLDSLQSDVEELMGRFRSRRLHAKEPPPTEKEADERDGLHA